MTYRHISYHVAVRFRSQSRATRFSISELRTKLPISRSSQDLRIKRRTLSKPKGDCCRQPTCSVQCTWPKNAHVVEVNEADGEYLAISGERFCCSPLYVWRRGDQRCRAVHGRRSRPPSLFSVRTGDDSSALCVSPDLSCYMNGHGFIAATSRMRAGNVSVPLLRARLTEPSSRGWRSCSRTLRGNSGSSSRNSTPWCARLTSPGRGLPVPPPIRPASEIV
jgi:hypothetical protein